MRALLRTWPCRVISTVVALTLSVTTCLSTVSVAYAAGTVSSPPPAAVATAPAAPAQAAATPTVVRELTERRTATATHYLLSDGSVRAEIQQSPVRFKDKTGAWRDVDTNLVPSDGSGTVRSASTAVTTSFGSQKAGSTPVTLTGDGYSVGIDYLGAIEGANVTMGSEATYPGVGTATDLTYEARNDGVKETLLLKSAAAPTRFAFSLTLSGLTLRRDFATGGWGLFRSGESLPTLAVAPLSVFDSSEDTASGEPAYCQDTTTTVNTVGAVSYVTYEISPAWLADPARVFPIRVDPTVTLTNSGTYFDTYVSSLYPGTSYSTSAELKCGYFDSTTGQNRSLVHFDISSVSGDPYVMNSDFTIHQFHEYYADGTTVTKAYLGALKGAFTAASTWNSLNSSSGNPQVKVDELGSRSVSSREADLTWAVDSTVQHWLDGTKDSYGFMLYQSETSSQNTTYWRKFRSEEYSTASQRPTLSVTYSNAGAVSGSGVDRPSYGPGDTVVATVHCGSAANADINAAKLSVRGTQGGSAVTRGRLLWSKTAPVGATWVTAACTGDAGGYVSYDSAAPGADMLALLPASCSAVMGTTCLDVTFAFKLAPTWGDVQDNDLLVTDYMGPTDGNDTDSIWSSGQGTVETGFGVHLPPVVTIVSPSGGTYRTAPQAAWSYSQSASDAQVEYQIGVATSPSGPALATNDVVSASASGPLPVPPGGWVSGRTYYVQVRAASQPVPGGVIVWSPWTAWSAGSFTSDTTPPTTTSNAQTLYTSAATIALSATDAGGSGVAATHYTVDGGLQQTGTTIQVAAPASGTAAHTLSFWSVDGAGNIETAHTVSFTIQTADTTPPTTTSNAQTLYTSAATIVLSATDAGGSGVAATHYTVDGGPQQSGTTIQVAAPESGTAAHTLSFWSVDGAGNIETAHTVSFTIQTADTTPPTTTSNAQALYTGAATIALSATDAGGSGVAATHYTVDGGPQMTGTTIVVAAPESGTAAHTLTLWSVDGAGNVETAHTVSFTIVAPVPAPTAPVTVGGVTSAASAAWFTETDTDGDGVNDTPNDTDGSGRGSVSFSWLPVPGATTYYVYLLDGATYQRVGMTSSTSWTSAGAGIYPKDSQIAAMQANTTGMPYPCPTGLDLRDDPTALYAKMAGATVAGIPAYFFKVTAANAGGESPLSTQPTTTVQLDNRTIGANDDPQHATATLGTAAEHDAEAVLDTGALRLSVTDLAIASVGPQARVSRVYTSTDTTIGAFGPGWRFNFDQRVEASGTVRTFVDELGDRHRFVQRGDVFYAPDGFDAQLTTGTVGTGVGSRLKFKGGDSMLFDSTGVLVEESDNNGNKVVYDRQVPDQLSISAANGQTIVVSFSQGRVTEARLQTSDGARWVTYSSLTYGGGDSTAVNTCTYCPGTADARTVKYDYGITDTPGTFYLTDLAVQQIAAANWHFEAWPRLSGWSDNGREVALVSWSGRTATITHAATVFPEHYSGLTAMEIFREFEWNPTGTMARQSNPYAFDDTVKWNKSAYSPSNRISSETDPLGGAKQSVYDARGNMIVSIDEEGHTTTSVYGTAGGSLDRVVSETGPSGATTTRSYDTSGNLTLESRTLNAAGNLARTAWTYDGFGRVTKEERRISDEESATTLYSDFAQSGEPQTIANPGVKLVANGSPVTPTEHLVYDAFGDLASKTDALGNPAERNTYSIGGYLIASQDASGTTQHTDRDALGRATSTYRQSGATTVERVDYTLDSQGNVTREDHYDGSQVSYSVGYTVDALGRTLAIDDSIKGSTAQWYDASGNVAVSWGPEASPADQQHNLAAATRSKYDAANRLVATIAPGKGDSEATTSTYSPAGNMVREDSPDGSWVESAYDACGNKVSETRPTEDGGRVTDTSVYDLGGRLTSSVTAVGTPEQATTSHVYDALDRQTSAQLGAPSTTVYNTLGWVLAENESDGIATTRVFDQGGRTVSETVGGSTSSLFAYAAGSTKVSTATVVSGGATSTITYNQLGQESARTVASGALALSRSTTSRDPEGRPLGWQTATVPSAATYTASGQLQAYSGPGITGTASVTHDGDTARKTAESVALVFALGGYAASYVYTDAGRLSHVSSGTTTWDYAFDTHGNLVSSQKSGESTAATLTYDQVTDRLLTAVSGPIKTNFTYDTLGRRTAQGPPSSPSQTTLTFDDASRLRQWAKPSAQTTATYTYDGAGQRVHSSVATTAGASTETTYTYQGLSLLSLTTTRSDNATWTITYFTDESGRPFAATYAGSDTTTPLMFQLVTTDHGDVVELLDAGGAAFATYRYDAWGNPISSGTATRAAGAIPSALAGSIAARQPLRYAGYAYDAYSGLYYCSQRYYDPATFAFISKDSARADGEASAYQYCGGDSVGKADPSGQYAIGAKWYLVNKTIRLSDGFIDPESLMLNLIPGAGVIARYIPPWVPFRQWIAGKIKDKIAGQVRQVAENAKNQGKARNYSENVKGYIAWLDLVVWGRQFRFSANTYVHSKYWAESIRAGQRDQVYWDFTTRVFVNPFQEAQQTW